VNIGSEKVIVSTMHKAKGKEFDNVFLLLNNIRLESDEKKRLVYVSVTRAKKNLYVHNNIGFANSIRVNGLKRFLETGSYSAPAFISMQLTHKDVYLSYFIYIQHNLTNVKSGDRVILDGEDYGVSKKGNRILRFSNKFMDELSRLKSLGYEFDHGIVNYIVFWRNEKGTELRIVLPEIVFRRVNEVGDFTKVDEVRGINTTPL
jgi:ATP-dependent DNA helicase RecQ